MMQATRTPAGTVLPANTGRAGAIHRVGFFAGVPTGLGINADGCPQKRVHIYHMLHRDGFEGVLAASEQLPLHAELAGAKSGALLPRQTNAAGYLDAGAR